MKNKNIFIGSEQNFIESLFLLRFFEQNDFEIFLDFMNDSTAMKIHRLDITHNHITSSEELHLYQAQFPQEHILFIDYVAFEIYFTPKQESWARELIIRFDVENVESEIAIDFQVTKKFNFSPDELNGIQES